MSRELVTAISIGSMLAYALAAYRVRARAKRDRPPTVAKAGGLARTLPFFIWVPYVVIALRPGPELETAEPLRWAGLALIVAGPLLMSWSAATLGRHFDVEVEVHGGHEVVRRGPYGVVRHPIYSGIALHFLGACLATGNVLFIAGTLFVAIPALYQRAFAEERLLRAQLAGAYERYARDVPMLVPLSSRRSRLS